MNAMPVQLTIRNVDEAVLDELACSVPHAKESPCSTFAAN